eukprot:CFRG1911T1
MRIRNRHLSSLTNRQRDGLGDKGIMSDVDLANADEDQIIQILVSSSVVDGCYTYSHRQATDFIEIVLESFASLPQSAVNLLDQQIRSTSVIPVGTESLDYILHGGLYTGEITEICGLPGTGKTQICLSATMSCISTPNSEGKVIYIDSSNNFSATRLLQFSFRLLTLDRSNVESAQHLLRNVYHYPATNVHTLLRLLHSLLESFNTSVSTSPFINFPHDIGSIRLVIIDSICPILAPILTQHPRGHSLMMSVITVLRKLTKNHNIAVLLANSAIKGASDCKPALGTSWISAVDVRMNVSHHDNKNLGLDYKNAHLAPRVAQVIKTTRFRTGVLSSFAITSTGLE